MSDYTPTTDAVRESWADRAHEGFGHTPWSPEPEPDHGAAFDRWLAAHDREVAARALRTLASDMGHAEGCHPDPDRDPYLGCRCRLTALYARATRIESGETDA